MAFAGAGFAPQVEHVFGEFPGLELAQAHDPAATEWHLVNVQRPVAGGVTSVVVPPDADPPLDEPELADRLHQRQPERVARRRPQRRQRLVEIVDHGAAAADEIGRAHV